MCIMSLLSKTHTHTNMRKHTQMYIDRGLCSIKAKTNAAIQIYNMRRAAAG